MEMLPFEKPPRGFTCWNQFAPVIFEPRSLFIPDGGDLLAEINELWCEIERKEWLRMLQDIGGEG